MQCPVVTVPGRTLGEGMAADYTHTAMHDSHETERTWAQM